MNVNLLADDDVDDGVSSGGDGYDFGDVIDRDSESVPCFHLGESLTIAVFNLSSCMI